MSAQDDKDKTRVQPRQESAVAEDRTRFAPRKGSATPAQGNPASPAQLDNELTRVQPRANTAKPPTADKTRVISKKKQPVTSEQDKTRFAPKVPPAAVREDNTRISIPSRAPGSAPAVDPASSTASSVDSAAHGGTDDEAGMLKNRFLFEEVVGTGGMGIVYKAKDMLKVEAQDRDPYVAIKVLSDEFKAHPEAFIALQRESRKTQRIAHPNIVNVYDFDRDGDTVFMTMEYMEGKPLDKLISQYRSTGLPPEDAVKILEGISAALIYAHEQHIIHSDFKPGNIFVTHNGTAKVFDFGIARAVAKAENREESLDDKTVFDAGNLGALTPAYASLEMLEGNTPDIRDDVYALGCIAYEMFTGEHPYNRVHADEALRQKLKPHRIPGIRANQWKAIEGALALKRENRIASVDEFLRKFNQKKSHTFAIVGAVVSLFVAAAGGVYSYWPEAVGISDGEVRSEIEQQLRIELRMQNITDMLASPRFSEQWEAELWEDIQVLRDALGTENDWLTATESHIYQLYANAIAAAVDDTRLDDAERLLANAHRYTSETEELVALEGTIADARTEQQRLEQERQRQERLAQQRRERQVEQAKVEAEKKSIFDGALANVENQLDCRNHLDMGDFEIALNKLKSISAQQYKEHEGRIVRLMGQCIARIGEYFPDRAEETKKQALALFNNHRAIAAVKIVPKDSCSSSLAGLGSSGMRATCRDILKDNGRGPLLVVAPGQGNLPAFAIGKYEVTTAEYNQYCEQSSACTPVAGVDPNLPITDISLQNARAYLRWLSSQSGRSYRLPTVDEWRHAAAANSHTTDPNRNCRLQSRGISRGSSLLRASVGQQNPWGLVNHLGNAREWAVAGGGSALVVGGAYESPMEDCSVNSGMPHDGTADKLTGFRVLREMHRT